MLISREAGRPVRPSALSKTYLPLEEALEWYVRPTRWFADNDVALRSGASVTSLGPALRTITLDSGGLFRYQKGVHRHWRKERPTADFRR